MVTKVKEKKEVRRTKAQKPTTTSQETEAKQQGDLDYLRANAQQRGE